VIQATNPRIERLRALRLLTGHAAPRELPRVKSDINVTPLVDVVLVLLIIFMVVTPLIASGVTVDLPRTVNHSRKPDEGKDIILSVTQDKHIYLGSVRLERSEDVGRAVRAELRKFPNKSIFLKGDARAPYGTVREVMEALHEADIQDVVLGTEELNKP
jgi:biopolymer transport protein ExbD